MQIQNFHPCHQIAYQELMLDEDPNRSLTREDVIFSRDFQKK